MRTWIALVAVVSLLIIAACSGANPVDVDAESDPTDVGPVLDPDREVLADPDGGELVLAGGDVELDVPAGAVTQDVVLTADPVEDPPEGQVGALPGTVFDLGPDGFEFEQPIVLSFTYDPAVVTEANPNTREEDLRLFTLVEGVWIPTEDSSVDPVTHTVSGSTTHFSRFGVLTLTQVCPGGSLGAFDDVQAAYDASIPGGMIEICDGTHSVEGVVLDAPVTIRAVAGASPVIETSVALSTFFLDGYTSGTVVIEGLTFNFDTPDGGDIATRSYVIRGTGTYDQLIVLNSTFNIGPVSRGSVFFWNNTVTGSGVLVANATFNGGVFGVVVFEAGPDTRLDVLNSLFSGILSQSLLYGTASGRVEGSTFEACGAVCVRVIGGSLGVEVVSNDFTGSELTGESPPDLNSLVIVSGGSSVLIDDNDMVGCGYFQCVGVFGVGTDVTTSNNRLTFVPGRLYNEFNAMIRYENDPTGLVEGNQITGCFFLCINVTFRANVTVRANQITIPAGQTAGFAINGFGGEDPADSPTLVVEDNIIIADMTGVDLSDPSTFRITGSGIEMGNATATVYRNRIVGAARGVVAFNGGRITAGEDNVIDQSHWGVMIQDVASINLSFNDITNSFFSIFDAASASDLTCNWWGDATGPGSNTDGIVDLGTYSPWAIAPIANSAGGLCTSSPPPPPTPPPPSPAARQRRHPTAPARHPGRLPRLREPHR